MSAQDYRATLQNRFQTWNELTGVKMGASWLNIPSLSPPCNLFLFLTQQ